MENKKTLLLLVGETGAGKDTVANMLPYSKVISYTTRSMRKGDVQDVHHHFISNEEMDELEKRDDLIAYTKTGDIRYCATEEQLDDEISVYVINPDGIRWFKENYKGETLNSVVFGLYVSLEERRSRCEKRGDIKSTFETRVSDEQQDFNIFRLNGEFDYLINNKNSNKTSHIICNIMEKYHVSNIYCNGEVIKS